MARDGVHLGEYDSPGNIGRAAPVLRIDEISDAHQKDCDRTNDGDEIRNGEEGDFGTMGKVPDCQQHADQAAMKGHPPIPELDNLNRVRRIEGGLVENDLTEPAADDGPQHSVENEVNEACRIGTRGAGPKTVGSKERIGIGPAAEKSENVGEGIPADGKRSDTDSNRIDRRKYYDKCCHHEQNGSSVMASSRKPPITARSLWEWAGSPPAPRSRSQR